MAAVWGRAEIEVHADGSTLPREIRRMAQAAGDEGGDVAGKAFNKTFAQRINEGLRGALARFNSFFKGIWAKLFRRGGKQMGDGFTDGFKDSMKTFRLEFDKFGTDIAKRANDIDFSGFGNGIRDFDFSHAIGGFEQLAIESGRVHESFGPILEDIGELKVVGREGGDGLRDMGDGAHYASGGMIRLHESTRNTNDETRRGNRLWSRFGGIIGGVGGLLKGFGDNADKAGNSSRRLSHGLRQAVFWTTLIATLLPQASVLGSALTGTIIALATELLALGAAAGFAVVGFMGLFKEGAKLNEGAKNTKKAFQDLGGVFKNFQQIIVDNMFGQNFADAVNGFSTAIKGLDGVVASFAKSTGDAMANAFVTLSDPKVINGFATLLSGLAPIIDTMIQATLSFGGALGNILIASLPTAQAFAEAIRNVGDRFAQWTLDNPERLAQFFDTAERIMPQVIDLFAEAGKVLAGLVTPETTSGLEQLIQALIDAMPALGGFLSVLGNLNVFGILAAAINTLFDAITPLLPSLQEFGSAFGGAVLAVLEALAPILADVLSALIPFVNMLTDFFNFVAEHAEVFAPIIATIAGVIIAFNLIVGAIGILVSVFETIATVISVVRIAWGLLSLAFSVSPIGLIITAIVALVAGLIWFFTQTEVGKKAWQEFTNFISDSIGFIGEAIANIGQFFSDVFTEIGHFIDDFVAGWNAFWAGIGTGIAEFLAPIGQFFVDAFTNVVNFLTGFFDFWVGFFAALLAPVIEFLQPMFDAFSTIFQGIVLIVTGIFNIIVGLIRIAIGIIMMVFTELGNFFGEVWANISNVFITAWNAIVAFITPIIQGISDFFHTIFDAISTWWNDLWAAISAAFSTVWNAVVAFIAPILASIAGFFHSIFDGIASWWSGIWNGISNFFKSIWNGLVGFVGGVIQGISNTLHSIFDGISSWWSSLWNGISSVFKSIWNGIESFFKGVINGIINTLNGMIKGINGLGSAFGVTIPLIPRLESGGIALSSMIANIGENGPEAVVPLRRPLGMVDPRVRGLSAIAQGKAGDFGGFGGNGRVVNIAEGAVQVNGALQPERTAMTVVNRLAERIAG